MNETGRWRCLALADAQVGASIANAELMTIIAGIINLQLLNRSLWLHNLCCSGQKYRWTMRNSKNTGAVMMATPAISRGQFVASSCCKVSADGERAAALRLEIEQRLMKSLQQRRS